MITINSHKQRHLFDPWGYLSPKRRKMLDESWAGLFQKQILLTLPAKTIASYFDKSMGRPTKELHTALGVLVLQQTFNLTDLETVEQFAFNIQSNRKRGQIYFLFEFFIMRLHILFLGYIK